MKRWLVAFTVLVLGVVAALTVWLSAVDQPQEDTPKPLPGPDALLVAPSRLLRVGPQQPTAVAPEVPLLPPGEVTPKLAAACRRIDDACRDVPLWTPKDFEATPRLRLTRSGAGAVVKGAPGGETPSPWSRCVDRTLAGTGVDDLALRVEEADITCPPSARPREDFFWHDREPFEAVVARCLFGASLPSQIDAALDLVVSGDVVEVQNVRLVTGAALDGEVQRCIEQELASTRVPFTAENRPGFDRFEWTFKVTTLPNPPKDPAAAFTLSRGGQRPPNPTEGELSQAQASTVDFPQNPYVFARLGADFARRYANTGQPRDLAEARRAYERFLQLASPVDPLVPVIEGVLEASPR